MRGGDRPIYGGVQPCTGDGCGRPVMGGGLCDVCLGHVAPPAPVELTAEEIVTEDEIDDLNAKINGTVDALHHDVFGWLREHGFRLVREG